MFSKSDDKSKSRAPSLSGGVAREAASTPSIISADLKVVGNLESAGDLQIDGRIEGDIKSRSVARNRHSRRVWGGAPGQVDVEASAANVKTGDVIPTQILQIGQILVREKSLTIGQN